MPTPTPMKPDDGADTPDGKYWCAACGKFGDHRSGGCPTISHHNEALHMSNLSKQSSISVTTPDRATELAQLLEKHALDDLIPNGMICPLLDAAKLLRRHAQVEAAAGEDIGEEFEKLCQQLDMKGWTVGDYSTHFAFFAHGWYGRMGEAAYQSAQPTPGRAGG